MKVIFDKRIYLSAVRCLEWVRIKTDCPRAIAFIPPLIGGHYSQQVRYFRPLLYKNFDIISFNYSGHGSSTDKFSLEASLRDTLDILKQALYISRNENLPLYGIASCYASIPLFYACTCLKEPLIKIVLINAVCHLNPKAVIKSFISYYRDIYYSQKKIPRLMDIIYQYMDFMFPGILKNRHSFGMLQRKRARILKIIYDFLLLEPLKNIQMTRTPGLCLYSSDDRILKIFDPGSRSKYESDIKKICPEIIFYILEGDHYLSRSMVRKKAMNLIIDFFHSKSISEA
ncbi:alpha/beta hydrolase fold-containing [Desulfonema limicola]|uniref:Alpha/beta hydrolase fold-containing n=1 Tax=Desulfonema limicola TaxID=45656 RepID=A0A975GF86_9BACT|nr:hypothetical protein [Desulfonema limicola]QTA78973.1 alpha/beta hydrolase fold-containing [Desulfonema limicola]